GVPYTMLISPAAGPLLDGSVELIELRGAELPARRAFVLAGREKTGAGRPEPAVAFVGRRRETELLWSGLESAIRGQGQIVGVSGEPGIRKSRLISEFREGLTGRTVLQFEGQCLSYGPVVQYQPILDVLRALCRTPETDSPGTMAEKARTTLLDAGLDLLEHAPSVLHVLGLEPEAEHVAGLGPEVTKARVVETLRQGLLKRSRENPLVAVIEDLHWIDRTSEECLASLAEIRGRVRPLPLCPYRHGYRPPWIEKSFSTQVALQRLVPEDSARIIHGVLGADQAPNALVDLIIAKAEGNPFFLEELARAVRESGGALAPVDVPDTIQEVLLARIGRLPHEDRELLQMGAVVGKDLSVAVVKALG